MKTSRLGRDSSPIWFSTTSLSRTDDWITLKSLRQINCRLSRRERTPCHGASGGRFGKLVWRGS